MGKKRIVTRNGKKFRIVDQGCGDKPIPSGGKRPSAGFGLWVIAGALFHWVFGDKRDN